MGKTNIEWADFSWNPWEGCTKISPGCANCYALARNHRFGNDNWGRGKPRHRTSESNWRQPIKWNRWLTCDCGAVNISLDDNWTSDCPKCHSNYRRQRVFCASLADWLDDEVPVEWLADLLKLIHDTPNLSWLLLTKRIELWERRMMYALHWIVEKHHQILSRDGRDERLANIQGWLSNWVGGHAAPANIFLGVSVEDQKRADERIPALLSIPAHIRFISCEPMLERIDFSKFYGEADSGSSARDSMAAGSGEVIKGNRASVQHNGPECKPDSARPSLAIHQIIFGGESGHGARPCDIEWIRDGVKQCRKSGVAPFVKQIGSAAVRSHPQFDYEPYPSRDRKGDEMEEWPEDLRVREFPVPR